ncbi:hypothetical protein EPN42_14580 [bacterium]|nr:MAG: hypothetical protein EPN42_14580 [bacterium]
MAVLVLSATLFPQPGIAATHHPVAAATASAQMPMFDTEQAAQAHCPSDVVVWLNTRSGIWHEKGMCWYGRTRNGAYVCRREAAAAGDRDTRNGQ